MNESWWKCIPLADTSNCAHALILHSSNSWSFTNTTSASMEAAIPLGYQIKTFVWAKLVAVVDVFDALTGERPYRAPITPQHAIGYLRRNAGTHFDAEIVQCWETAFRE